MRGKRSKQYRKLMQQYGITFGFREPYQVLLDADIIKDAGRFKMDLIGGLERALHGKVKPSTSSPAIFLLITQCSMRHLYTSDPPVPELIAQARTYERRRCNHHTLDEPLTTLECLSSVVDPKASGTNKHRYVVASQSDDVRSFMRNIPGVPLVYIRRSVMILEPMAGATEDVREREERRKFRSALSGRTFSGDGAAKRKRVEDEPGETAGDVAQNARPDGENGETKKKKKRKGPKGPNPLSVKKPKKRPAKKEGGAKPADQDGVSQSLADGATDGQPDVAQSGAADLPAKKRRKRKHGAHRSHGSEEHGMVLTVNDGAGASGDINGED